MLTRIHQIKGIGLLHDADGRSHTLTRANFIYADNGRGKSTLASIFRSCSINKPELVLNRKTIDGSNAPEVIFQFDNGQRSTFQNNVWDQERPELLVFDSDFVEQNVYAGGQVTTDQRKNLLRFALGKNAINAQREYDQADENLRTATSALRGITNQLSVSHRGLSLSQFQNIEEITDADIQIGVLNEKIVEAQNINLIQAKALPKLLIKPNLEPESIFGILATSLHNIDIAAEEQVKNHINSHNKPKFEKWVSDGIAYGDEKNCPFCNQSLEGIELINAYRSYFNQEYNKLKADVIQLESTISTVCSESIIERLKSSFTIASATIDGWQEHIKIPHPAFDEAGAEQALLNIRTLLTNLKQDKERQLLEPIGSEEDLQEVKSNWQEILNIVDTCNSAISNAKELITNYKTTLASVNIESLRKQIQNIELSKTRYRPDIIELLSQLNANQERETNLKREKQEKKDSLNQIMQTTLESYKNRINELLRGFGAQFTIPNIDFDYRGGLRSDYTLEMRGSNIALSGGVPDFKTSLSEGDKRTLAFAFFIASTESDNNLPNRIVIIDDPMCSLDLNRKQQTRTVLKRLHDSCEQIIILAHDIHFLRHLRDDVLREAQPNNVKCLKLKSVINRYSNFDEIDLDSESESTYFKAHRMLNEYRAGTAPSSMEIARSIRPMLEGYLHRRFPGLIRGGLLFGQIIGLIDNAISPSPLIHAQNITSELNEINRYAGQFHHDTNPAADQVAVVDGELLGFVERAIRVIYAGAA